MSRNTRNAIFYIARADEPPLESLSSHFEKIFTIPQQRDNDPARMAEEAILFFGTVPVTMFIPGTLFDMQGNRRGRGGGWYDRFVSLVPPIWQRVGVCFPVQISTTPFTPNSWDQPMDWLYVLRAGRFDRYETRAR